MLCHSGLGSPFFNQTNRDPRRLNDGFHVEATQTLEFLVHLHCSILFLMAVGITVTLRD